MRKFPVTLGRTLTVVPVRPHRTNNELLLFKRSRRGAPGKAHSRTIRSPGTLGCTSSGLTSGGPCSTMPSPCNCSPAASPRADR